VKGGNNTAREKCLRHPLNQFLAENFNKEIAGEVGLKQLYEHF
jgi:hypothetical protein